MTVKDVITDKTNISLALTIIICGALVLFGNERGALGEKISVQRSQIADINGFISEQVKLNQSMNSILAKLEEKTSNTDHANALQESAIIEIRNQVQQAREQLARLEGRK